MPGAAHDAARHHAVTRLLHWGMAFALAGQLLIGYAIDRNEDLLAWVVDGVLAGEEDRLVAVHVGLGIGILALAAVRLAWRRVHALPPWAPGLSHGERRLAHRTEQLLYATMFLIPATGLALVLLTGEDWELGEASWRAPVEVLDDDLVLGAHVATHLAFFTALALHLGLVFKHQFVDRDRLLRRML